MLSAVCCRAMTIGSVGCGTDAAVLLAAFDDEPADPAEPRVELAGARTVRVVTVAVVVVLVDRTLEHVGGALERGELGAPVRELDLELAKSGSCS